LIDDILILSLFHAAMSRCLFAYILMSRSFVTPLVARFYAAAERAARNKCHCSRATPRHIRLRAIFYATMIFYASGYCARECHAIYYAELMLLFY